MVELEARKLKYLTTGSESLLMGILTEGTRAVAKWLWKHGITLFAVRDETVELLGKEGEISTTTMLLLGIWEQKGSAGQLVLGKLDFDEKKAAELISTLTKKEPVAAASI